MDRFPPIPFPLEVPGAVFEALEVRAATRERVPRPVERPADVDFEPDAFFWA